jgi:beta-lactamase regulating signal transducer with metallopeptidase domain
MNPDILIDHPWLWTLIWQSTVCLGAGLGLSYWLYRRPVRAHQVLLLAVIGAVLVPMLSWFVARHEWGVFVEEVRISDVPEPTPASVAPQRELPMVLQTNEQPSVATTPAPVVPRGIRPESVFTFLWVGVSLLLLIRLTLRFVLAQRLVHHSTSVEKNRLREITEQTKTLLDLKRPVAYRATTHASSPMVWCWSKKPILLIPQSCATEYERLDWRGIVCHELAHYRRRDHLTMLMIELLICCLPWHVLLWWTRQRLLSLSEQACDDWAVVASSGSTGYARSLLELTPQPQPVFVPAVVNTRTGLAARVRRIINDRCASPRSGVGWTLSVMILMVGVIVGIAFAQTRPAPDEFESARQEVNETRSIAFPEDRSLGVVYIRDASLEDWYRGWEKVCEAKGLVSIPMRKQVRLQVNKESAADLSPLGNLQPNDIQMVHFSWEVVRIGSLASVGNLTGLKALDLPMNKFDDSDVRHLQGLVQLEFLHLGGDNFTNSSMTYVGKLTSLKSLTLYGSDICDEGLRNLQGLNCLTFLSLRSCSITDQGLTYLRNMMALRQLELSKTKITDAGLTHITHFPDLQHVLVSTIGDTGIMHLSKLPALRMLEIHNAAFTEAGVAHMKSMDSVQELKLSGDAISDELFGLTRAALPDCRVWDPRQNREYPLPEWLTRFRAVYRLDEDQVLKRIAPPFIPERREFYLNKEKSQAESVSRSPDYFTFHWTGKLKSWGYGFTDKTDLGHVLGHVLWLKTYEYEGPRELLELEFPGDWIIRHYAPQEVKLKILELVLVKELGRKIHFEKKTVERQAIIATGRFEYHNLPEANDRTVHLYIDELSMSGGGGVDSMTELLAAIGNRVNIPVVDNTEPSPLKNMGYYLHRSSRPLRSMENSPEKTELLQTFFANITKQTGLQFELAIRPTEVWVISEEK